MRSKWRKKVDNSSTNAMKKFRINFTPVTKPEISEPTMPKSVSSLSGSDLSDLMNRYTAWREFADDCLNDALYEYTKNKHKADYNKDVLFLITNGKNLREREMYVSTDPRIKSEQDSLLEYEMYHDLLLRKVESYSSCLAIISREISRRSGNV